MIRQQLLRQIEPFAFIVVLCGASLALSRFHCRKLKQDVDANMPAACSEPRAEARHPLSIAARQRVMQGCRAGSIDDCEHVSALYETAEVAPNARSTR